jgi:hypothetical protein
LEIVLVREGHQERFLVEHPRHHPSTLAYRIFLHHAIHHFLPQGYQQTGKWVELLSAKGETYRSPLKLSSVSFVRARERPLSSLKLHISFFINYGLSWPSLKVRKRFLTG